VESRRSSRSLPRLLGQRLHAGSDGANDCCDESFAVEADGRAVGTAAAAAAAGFSSDVEAMADAVVVADESALVGASSSALGSLLLSS